MPLLRKSVSQLEIHPLSLSLFSTNERIPEHGGKRGEMSGGKGCHHQKVRWTFSFSLDLLFPCIPLSLLSLSPPLIPTPPIQSIPFNG